MKVSVCVSLRNYLFGNLTVFRVGCDDNFALLTSCSFAQAALAFVAAAIFLYLVTLVPFRHDATAEQGKKSS